MNTTTVAVASAVAMVGDAGIVEDTMKKAMGILNKKQHTDDPKRNLRRVRLFQNKDGSPIVNGYKIGRNQSCPCGSGKKYKHCRMQSADCQICKKCGGTMKLYQNNKTGEVRFGCLPCSQEEQIVKKQEGTLNAPQ